MVAILLGAGLGAYIGSFAGSMSKMRDGNASAKPAGVQQIEHGGRMVAINVDRAEMERRAIEILHRHGARDVGRHPGGSVAGAAEQLEVLVDRQFGDAIGGGVPVMLELAVNSGEGDVIVLDADRSLALDPEIAGEIIAYATGDGTEVAAVGIELGIAYGAGDRARGVLRHGGRGDQSKSGGREKNVTHGFLYPLDVVTCVTSPIQRDTNGSGVPPFQRPPST